MRPSPELYPVLHDLTGRILAIAGPHHWATGSPPMAHFTVRPLERFRTRVDAGDDAVKRYTAALERAAARSHPVPIELRGLTLSPSCVMVCASPITRFADVLAQELGEDGGLEAGFDRNIWYATLVHFAGPITDPAGLVEWVAQRRKTFVAQALLSEASLVRYVFEDGRPKIAALATVRPGPSR